MSNDFATRHLLMFSLLAGAALWACGSTAHTPGDGSYAASVAPGTRAPADALEQTILEKLPKLTAGMSETIDGHSVTVGESYDAASGRTCKKISISGPRQAQSLACLMPKGWAYVPQVLGAESSGT